MSSNADIYHEMIVDYSRNPINYGEIENHDDNCNKPGGIVTAGFEFRID